ncbi:MAG: MFS transporter [Candidatus Thorarchaeota archaeon]
MQELETTGYLTNLRIVFRSRNYIIILFTNYSSAVFLAAWIYLNLFFRDIGISYFELGLADAWAMILGVFATLFGGYWADKYIPHRKYMATFNMLFLAIATFLISQVTDFYGLLIVWTVFGFSQFCQASIDPILFESLPPEQMGTGTSLFTLGGVFGLFGLIVVGFLIQKGFLDGLRIFWYFFTVIALLNFLIRLFCLEKTQPALESNLSEKKKFIQDVLVQYKEGIKVLVGTIPLFMIVFLLDVTSDINYRFAQNFYLNEVVGMDYETINSTMIGAIVLGVIGGLSAGFLLDRTRNEAKIMFLAYFFLPFSIILLFYSPTVPRWNNFFLSEGIGTLISSTAFIAVVIKAGNDEVWRTIAWGAVGRKLPREHTGKVMAVLGMSISLLGVLVSPFVGLIYQLEGGKPLLLIAFFLNLLILAFLFSGWLRSSEKDIKQTSPISM